MSDLVILNGSQLTTTSKIVADVFGKVHRNIIRDIDKLECSDEFREHNFKKGYYRSPQNKKIKCYYLTVDAVIFLCTGFTGCKSAKKKEALLSLFKSSVGFNSILEAISNIDVEDDDLFIYVARESVSKRYKIGISKNPEKRITQLNIGNPEELDLVYKYKAKNGFKDEALLHKMLEKKSIRSEWFRSDTDLSFILESQGIEDDRS